MRRIDDRISYIEASENPLSADVGVVSGERGMWLYDVGNDPSRIAELGGRYNAVLSHFHPDHVGNLPLLELDGVYVSRYTRKHVGRGIVVEGELFADGLRIFELPSSHAKGSLGLEAGEYAFVGDALCCRVNGVYNAQLLRDGIAVLRTLRAEKLLVSHFPGLIRSKSDVLRELEEIYSRRDKFSSEIRI